MKTYTVTAKYKQEALCDQAFEVMEALEKNPGSTMAQIAEIIGPKIKTVQTDKRIAGWYLKIFVDKGWATAKETTKPKASKKTKKPAGKKPRAKKTEPVAEPVAELQAA